jgi:hypothetical protein
VRHASLPRPRPLPHAHRRASVSPAPALDSPWTTLARVVGRLVGRCVAVYSVATVVRSHPVVPAPCLVPHCTAVGLRAGTGRERASESTSPHLNTHRSSPIACLPFPAHLGAAPSLKICPPCLNSCRRCLAAPHDPLLPLSALAFPRLAQHMTCARSRLASHSKRTRPVAS